MREESAFSDMLSAPMLGTVGDGASDKTPLTLSGDTAEEFRALCWMIYAT